MRLETLIITANSFGKTYGTSYAFAGNEFTDTGLVNGDTVSNVNLTSPGAAASATVAGGPYAITASGATGTGPCPGLLFPPVCRKSVTTGSTDMLMRM